MFNLFPLNVLFYQVYLLQLEEYSIKRYLHLILNNKSLPSGSTRKGIDWTKKLGLLFLVALIIQIAISFIVAKLLSDIINASPVVFYTITTLVFLATCYVFFAFLLIGLLLISPLDVYLKKKIINNAKLKIKSLPNLKIIGVAGSYGKTTMKEMLATILSQKYKVVQTPKSINTPIGISRIINNKVTTETEIFIVEMGEHYRGDIQDICEITKPSISVVTGINEAHLERMGSIQNTVSSIFEVVENSTPQAMVLLNADDELVMDNYQKFVKEQPLIFYGINTKVENMEIKNIKFHEDASGISFDMVQRGLDIGTFKVALLGEYIVGNLSGCIQLAQKLNLSINQIALGIGQMKPVEHRLQPIYNKHSNVLVIDDSYNGNPKGVQEAVKVLARFQQQRRIYLTPGLVESGERAEEIHYNIGKQLSKVAGVVILVRNSVTPYIAKGLTENGFDAERILWFDSAKQAHKGLGKILRPYDVILFQNDWPDNYY